MLHAENATYPWYPASVTKLMTTYTTLRAVREGRITLDSVFTVSPIAASQAPTKMGFPVGTQVTVDNAIKMLMVKSANDMAVLLAEGVAGSIENFSAEMNRNAQRLGMTQTNYVNPNGLPADEQITSARDLAILARALIREFPEYDSYWHLPGIRMGKRVVRNYNTLLGRYPGADGMKTGFICASGFNLVATATRDGRRLIAVVLGAPSSGVRAVKAAQLLEQGFNSGPLSWLTPSLGSVESLTPVDAAPANLHEEMCGNHRKRPAAEEEEEAAGPAPAPIRPMRCSSPACGRQPRAPACCRSKPIWASRSRSLPGRPGARPGRNPRRRKWHPPTPSRSSRPRAARPRPANRFRTAPRAAPRGRHRQRRFHGPASVPPRSPRARRPSCAPHRPDRPERCRCHGRGRGTSAEKPATP